MNRRLTFALISLVLVAVVAAAVALTLSRSATELVRDPVPPKAEDFSTPVAAVQTYLEWASFSYRMANSELATRVAGPDERVRTDSYIQLNREKGQGIEQYLTEFEVRSSSEEGTRAVVAASEEWAYRYFSLRTLRYITPSYTASYETTYTLGREERGWIVQQVEATPLTEVK